MKKIRKALAYPFVYAGIYVLWFGAAIGIGREHADGVLHHLSTL